MGLTRVSHCHVLQIHDSRTKRTGDQPDWPCGTSHWQRGGLFGGRSAAWRCRAIGRRMRLLLKVGSATPFKAKTSQLANRFPLPRFGVGVSVLQLVMPPNQRTQHACIVHEFPISWTGLTSYFINFRSAYNRVDIGREPVV
jgi:hypothetical protein